MEGVPAHDRGVVKRLVFKVTSDPGYSMISCSCDNLREPYTYTVKKSVWSSSLAVGFVQLSCEQYHSYPLLQRNAARNQEVYKTI